MNYIICILCALDTEYENIIKYFSIYNMYKINDTKLCECNNNNFLIVQSKTGKAKSKESLRIVIEKYKTLKCIISCGISGAINPDLRIGDIVVSNHIVDYSSFECTYKEHFSVFNLLDVSELSGVYKGKILSSDQIINNKSKRKDLYDKSGAFCVEMESAGIAEECNRLAIPFLAIKVISDYADESSFLASLRSQVKVTRILGEYIYNFTNGTCLGL